MAEDMKDKEWINYSDTGFKRFVKERGRSYRGNYYTIMSELYCKEHEVKAKRIKVEEKYHSEMTDRGRLGTYWDEVTWQCPICKITVKDNDNHTEKDESYHSCEERRVYRI